LWSGRFSDRSGKRKVQTSVFMALVALFLMLGVIPGQPFPLVMIWLCLAAGAIFAWPPPFWVLPTMTLGEAAGAASIGLINMMASMGGVIGPFIAGYLLAAGYSTQTMTGVLSACVLTAAIVMQGVKTKSERQ
jgi:ACS family tartrate transporter-like MFS transporter